jgi:hypothetical protein
VKLYTINRDRFRVLAHLTGGILGDPDRIGLRQSLCFERGRASGGATSLARRYTQTGPRFRPGSRFILCHPDLQNCGLARPFEDRVCSHFLCKLRKIQR